MRKIVTFYLIKTLIICSTTPHITKRPKTPFLPFAPPAVVVLFYSAVWLVSLLDSVLSSLLHSIQISPSDWHCLLSPPHPHKFREHAVVVFAACPHALRNVACWLGGITFLHSLSPFGESMSDPLFKFDRVLHGRAFTSPTPSPHSWRPRRLRRAAS